MSANPMTQLIPGSPSVPQVNLLPPEIRASRSLRRLKRLLLMFLALALVVAALAYVWATRLVSAANDDLTTVQAETARLLNEQKEFAHIPVLLADLEAATEARRLGMSTEVMWAEPLTQLMTTKPDGIVFEEIQMTGDSPMAPAAAPVNVLTGQGTAQLTFVARSLTIPDTADWIEKLESTPNFQDAYVTTLAITEEDMAGTITAFYRVTGSVQVADTALAHRFDVTEED